MPSATTRLNILLHKRKKASGTQVNNNYPLHVTPANLTRGGSPRKQRKKSKDPTFPSTRP